MEEKNPPELAGQDDFDVNSVVVRRGTGYDVRRNKLIYSSDLRKR